MSKTNRDLGVKVALIFIPASRDELTCICLSVFHVSRAVSYLRDLWCERSRYGQPPSPQGQELPGPECVG